jgi:hypothetical protein
MVGDAFVPVIIGSEPKSGCKVYAKLSLFGVLEGHDFG